MTDATPVEMDAVMMISIKKENVREYTDEEIEWWIREYVADRIPEYQMSAWLMAVCWRGLSARETATLTRCMVSSGEKMDWSQSKTLILGDKHSTGGVGDKVSLVLAPLVASMGVGVPMMAGRGLQHTGGTIDKLESIAGYQTALSMNEFKQIVESVGCSIISPTKDICPADRKLYALRDVTATVANISLITGSIMSKKIAENPQCLLLDIKYGRATFMNTLEEATRLAQSMIATGEANGVSTCAYLTHMDHTIGRAVGNWLEVQECIELMQTGKGCLDLVTLVVMESAKIVHQCKKYPEKSFDDLIVMAMDCLKSGKALAKFVEMVQAHGGDTRVILESKYPPAAKFQHDILAPQDGFMSDMDGLAIGNATVKLGAGRTAALEPVDLSAGIWFHVKVGEPVKEGMTVATLHTSRSEALLREATRKVESALKYAKEQVKVEPIISHLVTTTGIQEVSISSILSENGA